jgi:hypothetical protein
MKKTILFSIALLFGVTVAGQLVGDGLTPATAYCGTITTAQSWTYAYNSGIIYVGQTGNEDLTITTGGSLRIEAGITVRFCTISTDLIITNNGILTAIGTASSPITFTKNTQATWGHISFQNMTVGFTTRSNLDYCIIEFGRKNSSPSNIEAYGGGLHIGFTYLTVAHSIFRNNYAGYGGGIFVNKKSSPTISSCHIENNTSASSGGGLYFWSNSSSIVNNCLIFNNTSVAGGGGGGIFLGNACENVRIYNSTIVNNKSSTVGKNIHFFANTYSNKPSFINCIVWDPAGSISYTSQTPALSDFVNCAIQGYVSGYTSCINLNALNDDPSGPNFTNPLTNDYSITFLSPCIDKGTNTGAPLTDIIGNPRVGITDIGAYENQDFVWTGNDATNPTFWNVGTNWNHGTLPTPADVIAIRGSLINYPVVNTNATIAGITIVSGAMVTINPGFILTVTGTLTNNAGNAGLVIRSDANGNDAKLINNTPSVPATVELFLRGGLVNTARVYHYFVPPVESMTIGSTIAEVKTNLGVTNFTGDLLSYSEVAAGPNKDNGWQFFDGWNSTAGFSTISSSMGYNINFSADDKATFKGLLNATAHTFNNLSFTAVGFNLVGNPYPCNYDLTGIAALTGTGDNVDNTIYFNHDGGYAVFNVGTGAGASGYSSIMPPMQGFFVHVTGTGQSLSLPVSSKTASAAGPSRSKKSFDAETKSSSDIKKVKLVLNNGAVPDETIVCLIDKATMGFDGDYDAYKFFGGSANPSIYTNLNSVNYAINSVQKPGTDPITIPVSVVLKKAGTYKIDITEFENLGDLQVTLKHGLTETRLSKNASYSFTSAAGTFTNFQLIIGSSSITTSIKTLTKEKLKTWYNNNYVYINCPDDLLSGKGSLEIYDLYGKAVYTNNLIYISPGQTIQQSVNLPAGVYMLRVLINNQPFVSKIIVF